MRRPSDLWPRPDGHDGHCWSTPEECHAAVGWDQPMCSPRQYRRVASWLRRVADWYEHLAKKQEARCSKKATSSN